MEQKGIEMINTIVRKWTDKYLFLTKYLGAVDVDTYKYQCEFSLPCPTKPVPCATIKVYFLIKENENKSISFRFENDQLVHHIDQTIVGAKMEQWLERYLSQKQSTARILFLGTEFEQTRIKHKHLDKIAEDLAWREEVKDPRYLSQDLLEHSQELMVKEELQEQQVEQINRMRKVMFDMFRSVDKDDLGVVSHAEFVEVLDNMQLTLSASEKKFLINIADLDVRGIVDYKQFVQVGCEFIFGWFLKNEVDIMTEIKEEEFLIEAVMVIYNDVLMEKMQEVGEKCKEKDEDETGEVSLNLLEEILYEKLGKKEGNDNEQEKAIEEWKQQYEENMEENKKKAEENIAKKLEKERREREKNNEPPRKARKLSRQQKKLLEKREKQLKNWKSSKMQAILEQERGLAEEELEGFVKFVKRSYPEFVPYNQLGIFYLSYKVNDIKNGLMDSSLNKMDKYLISLFKRFEGKKKNRINLQQMVDALRQADKFCLSQFQLFMIQSFVEKDDEMMVDYTVEARFVGEAIKKFFTPVLNVKKVKFLEKATVNQTEFMNGWTEEQLKNQMEDVFQLFINIYNYQLFIQYDTNKDNVLDGQEYKNCVKGCRIRMNDQKIEEMMRMADTNKDGVIDKQEFLAHFYDVLKVYKCKLALERVCAEKNTI